MKNLNIKLTIYLSLFLIATPTLAAPDWSFVDQELLEKTNLTPSFFSSDLNIGLVSLNKEEQEHISEVAHELGRCGGFESLGSSIDSKKAQKLFSEFSAIQSIHTHFTRENFLRPPSIDIKTESIQRAVDSVRAHRLEENVEFLSSFQSRCHSSPTKNDHSDAMVERFEKLAENVDFPVIVEQISHTRTEQKSLRVRIEGKTRPDEIIILGGHYDSITGFWSCSDADNRSPGVDDNASGSSNLMEILKIMLEQEQPERTIEFMWYAAEEIGLVGSSQIASDYKGENKDVIGVLQLDMTLHPGDGIGTFGLVTDFTSPWLRNILLELNDLYVKADVIETRCGYACSDHASWHRQGYHAVTPFESSKGEMNRHIHTSSDVVNSFSSFEHSAYFARLGVAFALYLANSERQPND